MKLILCLFLALSCLVLHGQLKSGTLRNGTLLSARQRTPNAFFDSFDRADADPMSTNASDGLGVWTDGPGALNPCKIAFNNLNSSAGLDSGARVLSPLFRADQSASMVVGLVGSVGLMVRMQASTNASGYLCAVDDSTHVSIYRVVDVGFINYVLLGGTATVATINSLDTVTFAINGNIMNVYVNGVSLGITRTDSNYTSGQPGLYFYDFGGSIVQFSATEL